MSADADARALVNLLISRAGEIGEREYYAALDALQAHIERLDKLIDDGLPADDLAIYVQVDGTTVRFQEADKFAQWIQEAMHR